MIPATPAVSTTALRSRCLILLGTGLLLLWRLTGLADSQEASLAESSTSEEADSLSKFEGGLGTVFTPNASGS